jgi:O-acetyl-ADP-ribose deacetylase (regulator of RNase III)
MTTVKIVRGDLIQLALTGGYDVVIHGCNCFCTMGRGIALPIKQNFPEAYSADLATKQGDLNKLGTYSQALITRVFQQNTIQFTIVNAYTQYNYRGKGPNVDYSAVRSVFQQLKRDFSGKRFLYPRIGAGHARGDWNILSSIINNELMGEDHTLVEYQLAPN